MPKQEIVESAQKWGYILVYSKYSRKARRNVWRIKVPTTAFKNRPGFVRTRKVLEDGDLDLFLEKSKHYFAKPKSPIKVILPKTDTLKMRMKKLAI